MKRTAELESFSGSIGKISAGVYTEVVFVRACPSIAEPCFDDGVDISHRNPESSPPPDVDCATES